MIFDIGYLVIFEKILGKTEMLMKGGEVEFPPSHCNLIPTEFSISLILQKSFKDYFIVLWYELLYHSVNLFNFQFNIIFSVQNKAEENLPIRLVRAGQKCTSVEFFFSFHSQIFIYVMYKLTGQKILSQIKGYYLN